MNAQIVVTELQEIKLAGIMHIGEFDKMESMFQRLMKWGHEKKVLNISDFKAITVYHDNPNVTQLSKVRCSACITIDQQIEADGAIRSLAIKKGVYVVGRFEIGAGEFPDAWKNMCVWVIENGYEFRDGDNFEIYHNDHRTSPDQKIILDICIPIERTGNLVLDQTNFVDLSNPKKQDKPCETPLAYHELINYMKALRTFFHKAYEGDFKLGNIYQGNPDYSYFSLTTEKLKKLKLKFVLVLNHKKRCFTICLSGQNKRIRKKYWEIFKNSDWDRYPIVASIDNNLSIIDHTVVEHPDFENSALLTEQIEIASLKFMNELREILE